MNLRMVTCLAALLVAGTLSTGAADVEDSAELTPQVDHHQHLLSPAVAASWSRPVPAAVELPADLRLRFCEKAPLFKDTAATAELYTDDAVLSFSSSSPEAPSAYWIRGRQQIARFLAGEFRRQPYLTPVAYRLDNSTGYVAGYLTGLPRHFHVFLSIRRSEDGAWRITAQSISLVPPAMLEPITADRIIAYLDSAGIRRAAVFSLAYARGVQNLNDDDEYAQVRAENDWTSKQVARYPDRLRGFCSFNPLREYALAELDRCAKNPHLRYGLKLHFRASQVDLRNGRHVEQLRQVFRAANVRRMPIVVHLWTGNSYGAQDAQIFLTEVISIAPDIVVQVAHLSGAGPGLEPGARQALVVFADAVSANDPRTRNLYFDVATNVTLQTSIEDSKFIVARLRQIGLDRILYGSDGAVGGNLPARQSWGVFRAMLPLTEAEVRRIADNVAPYMR